MPQGTDEQLPTIDEILEKMDVEVDRTRAANERRGYFALMYRAVTERVRIGIQNKEFHDDGLMEQLDVVFARRWLDACDGWWADTDLTGPWEIAFTESANDRHLLLQHLLLGINAHINLDLGIAAVETVDLYPDIELNDLRDDFEAINDVLAALIDTMQEAMGTISPWMRWVDWVSGRFDEGVAGFAIEIARKEAWEFAEELSQVPPEDRPDVVEARAAFTADLARHIAHPPWPIRAAAWAARHRETHDLDKVMAALDEVAGTTT